MTDDARPPFSRRVMIRLMPSGASLLCVMVDQAGEQPYELGCSGA
jgi:hypothetical protein